MELIIDGSLHQTRPPFICLSHDTFRMFLVGMRWSSTGFHDKKEKEKQQGMMCVNEFIVKLTQNGASIYHPQLTSS
jgi:hypothetical protein